MISGRGRGGRAVIWFTILGLGLVALRLAATGSLATPPLTSVDGLEHWVDEREPVTVAIAIVRLGSELAIWYLLALSVLHGIASAFRLRGALVLADALSVPVVARLVHGALGLGLVTATVMAGDEATDRAAPAERDTLDESAVAVGAGTASMRPVGRDDLPGTAWMRPTEGGVNEPDAGGDTAPAGTPTTWSVAPGESFWTIAADVLEASWGRPPTDREIDPYWRSMVEANRSRLVDRRRCRPDPAGPVLRGPRHPSASARALTPKAFSGAGWRPRWPAVAPSASGRRGRRARRAAPRARGRRDRGRRRARRGGSAATAGAPRCAGSRRRATRPTPRCESPASTAAM